MIEACKVCGTKIAIPKLGESWYCHSCNKYTIVCMENGFVETEDIKVGNYHFMFFPAYKSASVISIEDGEPKTLRSFDMNELTHELAVHWVDKLKTYVVFQ